MDVRGLVIGGVIDRMAARYGHKERKAAIMLFMTGLTLLALGIAVWLFGNRMWLLGAGAGALLGFALLRWFPGMADGWLGFVIVGGLAILVGVLAFFGKAFASIIAMVIGFVAGGAITIGVLDFLGLALSLVAWLVALIGGVVGAILFRRFLNWGLIIFASLLGSLLIVRPLVEWFPSVAGTLGTLLILALTVGGIFYHYRKSKKIELPCRIAAPIGAAMQLREGKAIVSLPAKVGAGRCSPATWHRQTPRARAGFHPTNADAATSGWFAG